jgi:hypothetical protein
MEIKTCENYVVQRALDLENEVEKQKNLIEEQAEIIKNLADDLEFVGKFIRLREYVTDNEYYIDFNSVWSKSDSESYSRLCSIFSLVEPSEEDE